MGELDLLGAPTFAETLQPLTSHGGTIRLNLARLTFMDSTGINVLCQAAADLSDRGRLDVRSNVGHRRQDAEVSERSVRLMTS